MAVTVTDLAVTQIEQKTTVNFIFIIMQHRVISDYTGVEDTNSNIKVYVRARPLENEDKLTDFINKSDDVRKISIRDPDPANKRYGEVSFQFDQVFWTDAKQEDVFNNACRQQVDHVLNGYNSCCFACKYHHV